MTPVRVTFWPMWPGWRGAAPEQTKLAQLALFKVLYLRCKTSFYAVGRLSKYWRNASANVKEINVFEYAWIFVFIYGLALRFIIFLLA